MEQNRQRTESNHWKTKNLRAKNRNRKRPLSNAFQNLAKFLKNISSKHTGYLIYIKEIAQGYSIWWRRVQLTQWKNLKNYPTSTTCFIRLNYQNNCCKNGVPFLTQIRIKEEKRTTVNGRFLDNTIKKLSWAI